MVVRSKGSRRIEDSLLRIYDPSPSPFAVPPRMGLGLVIPKLKTDGEISAHYNIPLPALQQLKVKCWMRLGGHGNLWCFRFFIFVFKGGIEAASCSLGSHVDKSCAPFWYKALNYHAFSQFINHQYQGWQPSCISHRRPQPLTRSFTSFSPLKTPGGLSRMSSCRTGTFSGTQECIRRCAAPWIPWIRGDD